MIVSALQAQGLHPLGFVALLLFQTQGLPPLGLLQSAVDRNPSPESWLALARGYADAGREPEAVRAYAKAATPEAHEERGRLLRYAAPAESVAALTIALQSFEQLRDSAGVARCRRRLIDTLLATGAPADATRVLLLALAADPPDRDLDRQLPEWMRRLGRPVELQAPLAAYIERVPASDGATIALADIQPNGSRTRALELAQSVLERGPNVDANRVLLRLWGRSPQQLQGYLGQLEARLLAAQRLRDEGDSKAAEAEAGHARALERALLWESQLLPALLPLLQNSLGGRNAAREIDPARLAVELAHAAERVGDAEAALRVWLTGAHPSDHPSIYGALLHACELRGRFEEAERLTKKGLADPRGTSIVLFHYHRARALMHLDREAEAIAAADEAVRTASDSGMRGTRILKHSVLCWFGRLPEARAEAKRLLEDFPDRESECRIRQHLSAEAAHRRDDAEAEAHLRRVLELASDDVGAHNDLGYHLAERGRKLVEAESLCRFAVERGREGDDDASYRDSLGWVLFRRGKMAAAQEQLEAALALPGGRGQAVIWDHLGDVLAATGKPAEARSAWTESLAKFERSRRSKDDARPAALAAKLAIKY